MESIHNEHNLIIALMSRLVSHAGAVMARTRARPAAIAASGTLNLSFKEPRSDGSASATRRWASRSLSSRAEIHVRVGEWRCAVPGAQVQY